MNVVFVLFEDKEYWFNSSSQKLPLVKYGDVKLITIECIVSMSNKNHENTFMFFQMKLILLTQVFMLIILTISNNYIKFDISNFFLCL